MEDTKILDLYFARDEQAIAETAQKYGGYCFTLANSILPNKQDAEEAVSDTYWKTWNAIPPCRPAVLKLFLAKITRNLSFSRWRQQTAEKRGGGEMALVLDELSECVATPGSVEDRLNGKELAIAIRSFLDTLPKREQDVFLRRYFFVEESETIAKRYGMKQATVLRTLSRTRCKLKQYLSKEGYAV
ncbi:MAG: sigma-70 family RNA polymerase sigma factor [Oscillospiraceae bacterium]|nr:sigma-70 family RNA polymerase sigma factor [Oscillospiraceae bacterium]MBQ7130698.1 sigma-70 family RNA polymerase sigma factor [Oscillospiraceae bacterium]